MSAIVNISGAGCAAVNGQYTQYDTFHGLPCYKAPNGLELWYNSEWRIGRSDDYYYTLGTQSNPPHFSCLDVWGEPSDNANPAAVKPYPTVVSPKPPTTAAIVPSSASGDDIKSGKHVLGFRPDRTWVIVVCYESYEGSGKAYWASTRRTDQDFADNFANAVGVPKDHILCLLDNNAKLPDIKTKIPEFLQKSQPNDLLVFYWGSHGSYSGIDPATRFFTSTYESSIRGNLLWAMVVQNFNGSHIFGGFDTCYSGCMTRVAADIDKRMEADPSNRKKVFMITSTWFNQAATSRWRFLRCLSRLFFGGHESMLRFSNSTGANACLTLEDFGKYTREEMCYQANGYPEWCDLGFTASNSNPTAVHLGKVATNPSKIYTLLQEKCGPKVAYFTYQDCKVVPLGVNDDGTIRIEWCYNSEEKVIPTLDLEPYVPGTEFKVGDKVKWSWSGTKRDSKIVGTFLNLYEVEYQDDWGPERVWSEAKFIEATDKFAGARKIRISGAGVKEVNGEYFQSGEYHDLPLYSSVDRALNIDIWWNSEWRIGKTNYYMYVNSTLEGVQVPVNNWRVGAQGQSPIPTLTFI